MVELSKEQQQLLHKAKKNYSVSKDVVLKLVALAGIRIVYNIIDSEVQDELSKVYMASFSYSINSGEWVVN